MSELYNIDKAFEDIENDLISSMKKNMLKHINDEKLENINWKMWQIEMLKGLSDYSIENKVKLSNSFNKLNNELINILKENYKTMALDEEKNLLKLIVTNKIKTKIPKNIINLLDKIIGTTYQIKAKTLLNSKTLSIDFFKLDQNKMNALITATKGELLNSQSSILRKSEDIYRQIIFKSQVAANSGAKTIYQAVDLASHDFLSRGITNIRLKNGNQLNIKSYSEMAIRTANRRAELVSKGQVRDNWGIHTVLIRSYSACSPLCLPWQGKVYIDDVYSSGSKSDGDYKLLSEAIDNGLFHPNCRHTSSTYMEDISSKPKSFVDDKEISDNYKLEQQQRYNERQIRKYDRLAQGSLDQTNIDKYNRKKKNWQKINNQFIKDNNILRRDRWREIP